MINPKELGIGNYVLGFGEPLEVLANLAVQCGIVEVRSAEVPLGSSSRTFGMKDIKPIKITPEWLERLGFEFVKSLFFLDLGTSEVIVEPHGEMWQVKIILLENQDKLTLTIWYVHQLQSAIALMTGEELTLGGEE